MIAITTRSSMSVKLRRKNGPGLAEDPEANEGQRIRAAGTLSFAAPRVRHDRSSAAPARNIIANAVARIPLSSTLWSPATIRE